MRKKIMLNALSAIMPQKQRRESKYRPSVKSGTKQLAASRWGGEGSLQVVP